MCSFVRPARTALAHSAENDSERKFKRRSCSARRRCSYSSRRTRPTSWPVVDAISYILIGAAAQAAKAGARRAARWSHCQTG